jgi:ankyrin repeat protein
LEASAASESWEVTKLLLEHGADPNSQEDIHERPLLAVAFAGNDEIVDRFIKKGADVDVVEQVHRLRFVCCLRSRPYGT